MESQRAGHDEQPNWTDPWIVNNTNRAKKKKELYKTLNARNWKDAGLSTRCKNYITSYTHYMQNLTQNKDLIVKANSIKFLRHGQEYLWSG